MNDVLRVSGGSGPVAVPFATSLLTGVSSAGSATPDRLDWLFVADFAEQVNASSATASMPWVTCGAPVSRVTPIDDIEQGKRYFALLTDPGDTVFFAFKTNTDQTAFWLEGASGNLDADIYVQPDALPDKTSARSAHLNTSNEFIDGAYQGRTVYIAVNSRAGRGVVELHAASRRASARFNLTACTDINWTPTPTDLAAIDIVLRRGQEHFWAMTEGKVAVEVVTLRVGDCVGCDVCFHKFPGRAYAPGWVNLYAEQIRSKDSYVPFGEGPFIGARTLAHEWGHALLHLEDEYADCACAAHGADDRCRESAMSNQRFSLNLCTVATHGRSVDRNGHVCTTFCGSATSCSGCNTCSAAMGVFPPNAGLSAWERIPDVTHLVDWARSPVSTPDPTPYGTYGFPIFVVR